MWQQHLLLAVYWILFGALHSLLAALRVKNFVLNKAPSFMPYYRIVYIIIAAATMFAVIFFQIQLPSPLLNEPQLFQKAIGVLIGAAGIVIMIICIKKYFLSLSGLKSLFEEEAQPELMIKGIHRFVRHPLYLGTFMAIWGVFIFYPKASLLISNVVITLYTMMGTYWEEKKLVQQFGAAYKAYQQSVPMLLPKWR